VAGDRPAAVDSSTPSYFVYDELPHAHLLNESFAPNVVYYVWCGRRWFEFQHYLSVMSVIRLLRPDNIVFCYDNEPVRSRFDYCATDAHGRFQRRAFMQRSGVRLSVRLSVPLIDSHALQ